MYDSGFFEKENIEKLLKRYILKANSANEVSHLLFETFTLMKYWLPEAIRLSKNETRFRIIKNFFNPNTNSKTKRTKIYVADIIEINRKK